MFTSDLANIFTSASAIIFTSDLANMFTSDLANMFTSELEKCRKMVWSTCFLVKLTVEYVGLVPGIRHLIPFESWADHFVILNIRNWKELKLLRSHMGIRKKKMRPLITHSSRKDLEDALWTSLSVPPKHLLSHIEQNESPILEETNTNPNIQQIYNYRKKSSRENENPDPYLELVRDLLDPEVNNPNEYFNVLDHTQPFVREVSSKMLLRARFLTIFNEIFSRY